MLKVKNIPFVGGDTQTFEFDFGTKVAGSTAECPLNFYYGASASLMTPVTVKTTGNTLDKWNTDVAQSSYDQLKFQDGSCVPYSVKTTNYIAQFMVELDLTPLCNSLFGGSTSAMKAAIKNITVAFTALGHGSSSGTKAYSVQGNIWAYNGSTYTWNNGLNSGTLSSSSSSLTAMTGILNNNADANTRIFTDNKIYVLLSTYPSDGTIPSEVDLDYINIKLQFARVPDVINLLPITLPQTWSMLIKGFSPAWNTSDLPSGYVKFLTGIYDIYSNGAANDDVSYQNGKFVFDNWDGGTAENLWSDPISLNKFQTVNLLIEQTSSGRRMRILQNQKSVLKYSITSSRNYTGNKEMGVLMHSAGTHQADAFLNSIVFLPNKNFDDDAEAEGLLRGTTTGYEEDELFDITKLPVNAKNIVDLTQGTLTINADAQWEGTGISISVLPNNKYHFHCTTNNLNLAFIRIDELYNAIPTNPNVGNRGTDFDIITGSKTNNIFLLLTNSSAGSVTYSDISFKLKM